MAKWLPLVAASALLGTACLLPDLGAFGDARVGDGGLEAAPTDAAAESGPDADAGDAGPSFLFFDDFNRADGPSIGNGWIAKRPATFELKGGMVRWLGNDPDSYRDHAVWRPAQEDILDVKAQMTVVWGVGFPTPAYPQIYVRIQGNTASLTDTLDGYLLYVDDDPKTAHVARQRGTVFVEFLATMTIAPALEPGKPYRFSLSAVGTNPVMLTAAIEGKDSNGQWSALFKQTVPDADAKRIQTAGAVGFSAGDGNAGVHLYDDFSASLP